MCTMTKYLCSGGMISLFCSCRKKVTPAALPSVPEVAYTSGRHEEGDAGMDDRFASESDWKN